MSELLTLSALKRLRFLQTFSRMPVIPDCRIKHNYLHLIPRDGFWTQHTMALILCISADFSDVTFRKPCGRVRSREPLRVFNDTITALETQYLTRRIYSVSRVSSQLAHRLGSHIPNFFVV